MSEFEIRRERTPEGGYYLAQSPDQPETAELAWQDIGPGMIAANHTFAPPALRGTGAAGAMMSQLIADARAEGFKILPLCSYVRAQFDRHPEWSDLRLEA